MKVVIAGSRGITDYEQVLLAITNSDFHITEVVSGRARGVDTLGECYAEEYALTCSYFPANWNKHGKRAGHIRNAEIARYADAAVIVWDGESTGSANMIENMKRLNKPYYVWKVINNGTATLFGSAT